MAGRARSPRRRQPRRRARAFAKRYTADLGFETPPDETSTSRGTLLAMQSSAHATTPSRSTALAVLVALASFCREALAA
eukprot:5250866-Prymnesium_polylepis.2